MSATTSQLRGRLGWRETSDQVRCPACGHGRLCTISEDGTVALCRRGVESNRPVKQRDGTVAYMHVIADMKLTGGNWKSLKGKPAVAKLRTGELKLMQEQFRTAMSPDRLAGFARDLGISASSLQKLGIGYGGRTHANEHVATFPMLDGLRRIIGIRRRYRYQDPRTLEWSSRKDCVTGSSNGLFVPEELKLFSLPAGLARDAYPLLLLVPEGPTDCGAAMDLGFRAVGRPNDRGGAGMLATLLRDGKKQDVAIIADHDRTKYERATGRPFWPGWEGALSVASAVVAMCGTLKLIKPPGRGKDLRQWKIDGGTFTDLHAAVLEATAVDKDWLQEQWDELRKRKDRLQRKVD